MVYLRNEFWSEHLSFLARFSRTCCVYEVFIPIMYHHVGLQHSKQIAKDVMDISRLELID